MVKHVKAARSVPALPPRPGFSQLGEPGSRAWTIFPFPRQHSLVITTSKGVYVWDLYGITETFRSGSEGIVAAKQLASSNGMLAIADSQVVILHEIGGETQKSYRLKGSGSHGRVRLLQYAKESDSLFFTTDLQNSVQAYSLKEARLLRTSHNHPTPPTVFAVSCNSQFLISTSLAPPTINLTDMSHDGLPILVQPQCSSSAVIAAAFHPERHDRFLLAFADGTAAVFDARHFFTNHNKKNQTANAASWGTGGLLAFMKGLHAQGTKTSKPDGVHSDGIDPSTGAVGIGDKSWGITAVAFVPGRKATVVTAGADGKCCVVDFTQMNKQKAILLKTWHLRRPATSLSVIYSPQASPDSHEEGTDHTIPEMSSAPSGESHHTPNESYYIAVGRYDGRVLLFDLNGKSLGEQTCNENGAPIVDVEWTQAEDRHAVPRRKSSPAVTRLLDTNKERKALEPISCSPNRSLQEEKLLSLSKVDGQPRDSLFDFSTPRVTPRDQLSYDVSIAANHLDMMQASSTSPDESLIVDGCPQTSDGAPTTPSNRAVHMNMTMNSANSQVYATPGQMPKEAILPPAIPPRPSPRPGGLLSMRRAHTEYSYQAPADDSYLSLIANARNLRSNLSLREKSSFGPRPMRSRDGGSPLKSSMNSDDQPSSGQCEVAWSDIAPTPPPHDPPPRPKFPNMSPDSFQSASSQVYTSSLSDKSTDTVVDWDIGPTRQPFPSFDEDIPQATDRITQRTPKEEPHVSFSASPAPRESAAASSTDFTDTSSPIVQWAAFSPRYSGPGLHSSRPCEESPAKSKPKQKGHVSVPLSSASYDSTAPPSSTSGGLVVQLPSLKKSPRIPELNKALSFSGPDTSMKSARESATGFVLAAYSGAPSPPKELEGRSSVNQLAARDKQVQPCIDDFKATLNASLGSFRAEMAQRFDEQRIWLQGLTSKGDNEGMRALLEENRRLKAELLDLRKTMGQFPSE